jgi:hypothetical protein
MGMKYTEVNMLNKLELPNIKEIEWCLPLLSNLDKDFDIHLAGKRIARMDKSKRLAVISMTCHNFLSEDGSKALRNIKKHNTSAVVAAYIIRGYERSLARMFSKVEILHLLELMHEVGDIESANKYN